MTQPARQSNVTHGQFRSVERPQGFNAGEFLSRIPPHDPAAENAVLGAMMSEPKAAKIAVEKLTKANFYLAHVALLFEVVATMHCAGMDIDELCVRNQLVKIGMLEEIGGQDVLALLIESTPSAANIEGYCKVVLEYSIQRDLIKAAHTILHSVNDPEGRDGKQITEAARVQIEDVMTRTSEPKRFATVAELDAQFEDEISGARAGFGMPWPLFAESQAMTPGSRITICGGSGEGKSWLVFELLWRTFFENQIPCSSLNLEKDDLYHLRRNFAQLVGSNVDYEIAKHATHLTDVSWATKNPETNRMLREMYRDSLQQMEAARVFQVPGDGEEPTIQWVLSWIKAEFERGVKFVIIDPVTFLVLRDRWNDEKNFIGAAEKLVSKFQTVILFVTHPKTNKEGFPLRISKDNMAGVKEWHTKVDSVFWVTRHKAKEDLFHTSLGVAKKWYNSQVAWLKTKLSGDGYTTKRVAMNFNFATVQYEEIGIIPEEV